MKIFISYNEYDLSLAKQIDKYLEPPHEVLYWDKQNKPGAVVWDTIYEWIDTCDLFLVVMTGSAISRGLSIGKEIARAETMAKRIIPLVTSDVPSSAMPFRENLTFQKIDPYNPFPALERLRVEIQTLEGAKQQRESTNQLWTILAGLFLLYLASRE